MDFHSPLVNERFQAVVESAGADTQLCSDLSLGDVRAALQQVQHSEVGVFLQLRAAACHVREVLGTLPPCRVTISMRDRDVPLGNVCTNSFDFRVFLIVSIVTCEKFIEKICF